MTAPDGTITNWRRAAMLNLTPTEIIASRGPSMTKATVSYRLKQARRKLRAQGWTFVCAPNSSLIVEVVPPPRFAHEQEAARTDWERECRALFPAAHVRSNWGMRVRPGKNSTAEVEG